MNGPPGYQRFFAEMKRRRVFRVMAVYGIVGFVLLQVVDLAVPALLLPEWTYRFVALLLLVGFPVAIVLAWAFEMTPGGIGRTAPAAPDEIRAIASAPASQRWPIGFVAAAGTALLMSALWFGFGRDGTAGASAAAGDPDAPVESIAVLPFVDLSPEGDQAYFGDGLAEELLDALARVEGLRVAARTSSFRFRGDSLEIPDVARRLNVQTVLEGSVRTGGNRLRITAQLVDADGFHLWSATYDRSLDRMADLIAVQEEIARAIVAELELAGDASAEPLESLVAQGTDDLEAYNALLRGRYLAEERTDRGLRGAIEEFERAVELDPDYARAWAELAMAHSLRLGWGFELDRRDSVRALAEEAVQRALTLDPELAEAYTARGYIAVWLEPDSAAAEQAFARATELDPQYPTAWQWRGEHYSDTGHPESGIPYLERARDLDPLSPIILTDLAEAYDRAGRHDAADSLLASVFELEPEFLPALGSLNDVHRRNGDADAVLATTLRQMELRRMAPGMPWIVAAYHYVDRHDDAIAEFRAAVVSDTAVMGWLIARAVDEFLASLRVVEGPAAVRAFAAAHRSDWAAIVEGENLPSYMSPAALRQEQVYADGYAAAVTGDTAGARAAIEALGDEDRFLRAALLAAALGDVETALELLGSEGRWRQVQRLSEQSRGVQLRFELDHRSEFDAIRDDPRFQAFLDDLPPYHVPTIVVDPTP